MRLFSAPVGTIPEGPIGLRTGSLNQQKAKVMKKVTIKLIELTIYWLLVGEEVHKHINPKTHQQKAARLLCASLLYNPSART